MPFYRMKGLTVHINMGRRKAPKPCGASTLNSSDGASAHAICGAISCYLCDWPSGDGRTCDRALCPAHAHTVGKNKHFCPEHLAVYTSDQRDLFTDLVDHA